MAKKVNNAKIKAITISGVKFAEDTKRYHKFIKELSETDIKEIGQLIINIDTGRNKLAAAYVGKNGEVPEELHIVLKLEV